MGLLIDRESFDDAEYARFAERLRASLGVMRELLARPGFGEGERTLGAELEVSIVDASGRALMLDRTRLPHALDAHVTLEIDRFNLEYNLAPVAARGEPFAALERQLDGALDVLGGIVRPHGGRVAPIGILPTLRAEDLESPAMTDLARYRALSAGLRRMRAADFEIDIRGADALRHRCADVTLEGAGTSFQLHVRVAPREFARLYNACQLATAPALCLAANSPTFLAQRLWDETRVALFKQSVDPRTSDERAWRRPARVSFGHGWIHGGAYELFAEAVSLFPPLLPVISDADPAECLRTGAVPELAELRLHQGTVWRWNRAIYDPASDGHLRIELRALASGPAPIDMAASAAFLLGLAFGLEPEIHELLPAFPFEYAHWSFYRAAQHGLDAQLLWPSRRSTSPVQRPARELCAELVDVAARGLDSLGVSAGEADRLLGVVRARLASDCTPARWQRRVLDRSGFERDRPAALSRMLESYLAGIRSRAPVHEWSGG